MTTAPPIGEDALLAVVRRAWTDALPGAPFDPEQSWEASGADSLRSLHLVLNLERALDRKVPFDLISRQMTPRDLARRLAEPVNGGAEDGDAPTVFLVPGVFGDGPILAEFRRSFAGAVRFVVVDLPDLDRPVRLHEDLAATGKLAAESILRDETDGPICVAGFSYGGVVAFEAAHHLVRAGRRIAFLGLLDSFGGHASYAAETSVEDAEPVAAHATGGEGGLLARLKPRRGEGPIAYGERVVFGLALKFGRFDLARRVTLAGRDRLNQDQIIGRRKIILGLARSRAIDAWAPVPLDVPAFLACTDDGERSGSPAKWASLCPTLELLRIPGGHFDIFSPDALAILTPAFRRAVGAALATTATASLAA